MSDSDLPDGPTEADFAAVLKKLDQDWKQPYDGVLGVLPFPSPAWPKNLHSTFQSTRRKLLNAGYSPEELRSFIKDHNKKFDDASATKEGVRYDHPLTPFAIMNEIDILARYWRAVQLGESKGLALLTDPEHAAQIAKGMKFSGGRKKDSIGPVRKFIRNSLKKNPAMKNADLWEAFKKKPPRGWSVIELDGSSRGRIEGPKAGDSVEWRSFCTYVSEEKNAKSMISEGLKGV